MITESELLGHWLQCEPAELPWHQLPELPEPAREALATQAKTALKNLPKHLRRRAGELQTERGRWERLAAELRYEIDGESEPLRKLLHAEFFRPEDDPLPYRPSCYRLLVLLLEIDDHIAAGVVGRAALAEKDCIERERIVEILEALGHPSKTWKVALAAFAKNPSEQRWDEMMRFLPIHERYALKKAALFKLLNSGVDPNLLFVLGSKDGLLPDAMGYAEDGLVEPSTILDNLDRYVSNEMRATMWGLAAHAYWHKGDRFNVVRCLKEAKALSGFHFKVNASTLWRYEDAELNAMLTKLGFAC